MYAHSDLFARRIKQGGMRKTVADLYINGSVVVTDLPVSDGSIRVDRSAAVRRSGRLVIPDRGLVPSIEGGTLTPFGAEVLIRQGIVYPNGDEELIPLGVFVLETTSWAEAKGPIPEIEFFDRAYIPNSADIGPTLDYSGWTRRDVINHVMAYFWPDMPVIYASDVGNATCPGGTVYNSGSHWKLLQDMALALGAEIYFDVDGEPRVSLTPKLTPATTTADAVYEIEVGVSLEDAQRSFTRKEVVNTVYIVGGTVEGFGVMTGRADNDNPASPTYRMGPFKKISMLIQDNTLVTNPGCQEMAETLLAEYQKMAQTLSFTALPNPALSEGDLVKFTYRSGEEQVALVENLNIPLGKGKFGGSCSVAKF